MRYASYVAKLLSKEWKTPHRAYYCCVCGHPHVGKVGGDTANLIERREKLVAHLRRSGSGWLLTALAGEFETADRREWKANR